MGVRVTEGPGLDRRSAVAGVATGYGLGTSALPIAATPPSPSVRELLTVAVAVVVAALVSWLFSRRAAWRQGAWWGAALVAIAALLYSVTPAGVATAIIATVLGAGSGMASGGRPWPGRRVERVVGVVGALLVLGAAWGIGGVGSSAPFVVAAATTAIAVVVRVSCGRGAADEHISGSRVRRSLLSAAVIGAVALVSWTGCNDPQLSWFGPVSSSGPRDRPQVAITFDDGPNDTATLEIAGILDDHGVKGTFFLVGSAAAHRPDVARRLVADGHLVGNHSYHHDYSGWLNPLYPELGATQQVIGRDVGVCPRFFRPPHGQRTPLMNLQVARRAMVTVTWDVSAADWVTDDPQLVARRILDRVRPGSIVLLHDSIDGHTDADRQVVIDALPTILDGLARKGLEPVRIDEMLGGPAYLPDDDC